eukprot:833897-Ditylum_brightwellii.AAC.1
MLHRGIHPVVSAGGVSPGRKCPAAILDAKAMGYIKSGDDIIFVGIEKTEELGNFAVMKIQFMLGNAFHSFTLEGYAP